MESTSLSPMKRLNKYGSIGKEERNFEKKLFFGSVFWRHLCYLFPFTNNDPFTRFTDGYLARLCNGLKKFLCLSKTMIKNFKGIPYIESENERKQERRLLNALVSWRKERWYKGCP